MNEMNKRTKYYMKWILTIGKRIFCGLWLVYGRLEHWLIENWPIFHNIQSLSGFRPPCARLERWLIRNGHIQIVKVTSSNPEVLFLCTKVIVIFSRSQISFQGHPLQSQGHDLLYPGHSLTLRVTNYILKLPLPILRWYSSVSRSPMLFQGHDLQSQIIFFRTKVIVLVSRLLFTFSSYLSQSQDHLLQISRSWSSISRS